MTKMIKRFFEEKLHPHGLNEFLYVSVSDYTEDMGMLFVSVSKRGGSSTQLPIEMWRIDAGSLDKVESDFSSFCCKFKESDTYKKMIVKKKLKWMLS